MLAFSRKRSLKLDTSCHFIIRCICLLFGRLYYRPSFKS